MTNSNVPWKPMGAFAPTLLTDTRIVVHWAAQAVAAAADALLTPASDDSHTNLHWHQARTALVGNPLGPDPQNAVRIGLEFDTFQLAVLNPASEANETLSLTGKSLPDTLAWLNTVLAPASRRDDLAVTRRDYDMPGHPVADGAAFVAPDSNSLTELGRWYSNANAILQSYADRDERSTPVAIWPHHFDIGGIFFLDKNVPAEKAPQIGYGFSPGDSSYAEPYFYVTLWPIDEDTELPALPAGHWHRTGFTGAILTGSDIVSAGDGEAQRACVERYLEAAITAGPSLIRMP